MLERIETDAAALPGGVVAKMVRDKAVGRLMKGDGDDERQDPDRNGVKRAVGGQSMILTGSVDGCDASTRRAS